MVDKNWSELGDSELQEELLANGYTQHVYNLFKKLSPNEPEPTNPLESYKFVVIDLKEWVENYKKTL